LIDKLKNPASQRRDILVREDIYNAIGTGVTDVRHTTHIANIYHYMRGYKS